MIDEPVYKSPPTFRRYEDYHDAEQYTKGWNDAMDFIFPEAKREREMESIKRISTLLKHKSEDKK